MFFSCPLLRARFENQPKIDPKTLRERVARQIACERRFFSSWRPQNALGGPLGPTLALLGDSWGALGALLERSGALWDRSWGDLRALMGRSWTLLSALGRFWGRSLDDFGLILAFPRSILELDFGSETIKLGAI